MKVEALIREAPAWLVGEGVESPDHLLDRDGLRTIPVPEGPDDHYPDDYVGKVIAVRPAGWRWTEADLAGGRRFVTLDVTEQERGWLSSRTAKIIGGKRVPVTFDDRWGAVAPFLENAFGSREAAKLAEAKAGDRFDVEGRRFAEASALFKSNLARNVVHTGAGLYEVGDGKTYSTIQSALDQLWTDQGSAKFTASQYIRVFAGTYDENVTPNATLFPDPYRALLVMEGDPNDDRANIVLSPGSGTHALFVSCYQILVRHMTLQGSATTATFEADSGCNNAEISDCVVSGSGTSVIAANGNRGLRVLDSTVTSAGGGYGVYGDFRNTYVRNCKLAATSGGQALRTTYRMQADGCTFSGWTSIYTLTGIRTSMLEFRNNTFYDCVQVFHCYGWSTPLIAINNIVKDCGTVFQMDGTDPEESSTLFGPSIQLRNNCYHGNTNLTSNGDTYAELIAFNRVDAAGDLDDTDPLMTDPAGGDFSLTSSSPCRHAGHGSGIATGINGVAFDKYRPNIGAWASGIVSTPSTPVIGAISVSGTTVTVPITGDADVTNYARIIQENGTIVDTQSRSGDGDVDLTVSDLATRYYVYAWSVNVGLSGIPTVPEVVYVPDTNTAKVAELRAELLSRLEGSTTLQTLLGTDENGDYPIYQAGHGTSITVTKVMVYTVRSALEVELSQEGRRMIDITIEAEKKPDGTIANVPENWLDQVEQELDSLLNMWRPVTTSLSVKHSSRIDHGLPTYDFSGHGFVGREWTWRLVVDEV
jgi:hypothetical protein